MTPNSKLICPYCKTKQEYKAKDYFTPTLWETTQLSLDIQCDNCDQLFNATMKNNTVKAYTNLVVEV